VEDALTCIDGERDFFPASRRGFCFWAASNTCVRFHKAELRPYATRLA
jgi:hypothetical protein